ncbi:MULTISPECIES: TauD/TfdA family dioxygenase [unclassified Pseudomonas]|uniref:TauD/TfdA family dioxygenase n=1 Tax=unclassified Pseudomonas TaxID=196821 RepID=UPI00235F79C6|nr:MULTISPECIES: TauD/TfdA family dioxygenase [unclassified Pseudomonas]
MHASELNIQRTPPAVKLLTGQGEYNVPALWLREKTQDPDSTDPITQQRLFDSHLIDADIRLIDVQMKSSSQVHLSFSDGHRATYSTDTLLAELVDADHAPSAVAWGNNLDQELVRHDWRALSHDTAFEAALTAYLKYGYIVLTHVPNTPEQVLAVGSKFGYVKETNFGQYFEVYSKPQANDLAYRSVRLGPHTDNPYRDPVPGIQLLHCLVNETTGGLSTLVDSVRVVDTLMQEDLPGYLLLKNTPVRFRFVDKGVELTTRRPMIKTDESGHTLGVHYSPRLDSLPLLNASDMRAFHLARKRLAELFNHPDYEVKFRLQAGELMLFDNSRVLHGRTSYDPTEGHRHLQGCYIDLDGPRERLSEINKRNRRPEEAA